MTQSSNRLIDEFAKLATDAAAVADGVRREAETAVRAQAERFLSEMNLVQRDEYDAVKAMAADALDECERLRSAVQALEARVARLEATETGPASDDPDGTTG